MDTLRLTLASLIVVTLSSLALGQEPKPTSRPKKLSSTPYPLAVCPVSGEALGSMGAPVVHEHKGREVRFCCKGCLPKFTKEPEKYLKKVDELIVKQQAPHYPTTTCIVSGEPLSEDGSKPVDVVYQNRLLRFCCKTCKRDFAKDSKKYLAKLDAAVIAHHKGHYPLETCVVSGEKLGSMGKPYELVVANRLFRLCCGGCKKSLLSEPSKYLAKLDKAHGGKHKEHGEGHKDHGTSGKKKHDHDDHDH